MTKSDTEDETSTTLKVFKFSGKDRAKWREWKIKTLAYARRKAFVEAFTKEYSTDELKVQENVLKKNLAIDYLISCLTDSAFTKVTSKTTDDPFLAWKILHLAYERREEEDLESVQVELSNLKMGKFEEPDDFYNNLLLINERLSKISSKYELDDLQMKIHLLAKLPEEYQVAKKAIQVNGLSKKNIEDIVKDLNQVWKEKGYDKQKDKDTDDTNLAMTADDGKDRAQKKEQSNNKKKFEKDCGYCGKKFHRAKDCRGKKADETKAKETGAPCHDHRLCYNCKKTGHLAAECPNKDEETGFTAVFCVETDVGQRPLSKNVPTGYTTNDIRQYLLTVLHVENNDEPSHLQTLNCGNETQENEKNQHIDDELVMIEQIVKVEENKELPTQRTDPQFESDHVCSVITSTSQSTRTYTDEWLVDSGATINVDNDGTCLSDRRPSTIPIKVGNGEYTACEEEGTIGLIHETDGIKMAFRTHVAPGFTKKILSVKYLQQAGWRVILSEDEGYMEKLGKKIPFAKGSDGMWYIRGHRFKTNNVDNVNTSDNITEWRDTPEDMIGPDNELTPQRSPYGKSKTLPNKIDINDAHDRWGHKSVALIRKTANYYKTTLTGEYQQCEGCGLAKAKQKAVSKVSLHKATTVGERLYFDTAGPFHETASGSKFLFCCVDEHSRKGWVKFGPRKNGMIAFAKEIILELRGLNYPVKILRCDNAGENTAPLKTLCLENGVRLESTAPNTPQMNGVVERRIAVLIARANASMMAAGINEVGRQKLWAEAVNYHNDTENVTISTVRKEPAESALYRPCENLFRHLQPFGRPAIVTIRRKFSGKWKERGIKMILVGYAKGHPPDTYRMYHLENHTVHESRDVHFLTFSRLDPKNGISIFQQDDEIGRLPEGLDESPTPDSETTTIQDTDTYDDVQRSSLPPAGRITHPHPVTTLQPPQQQLEPSTNTVTPTPDVETEDESQEPPQAKNTPIDAQSRIENAVTNEERPHLNRIQEMRQGASTPPNETNDEINENNEEDRSREEQNKEKEKEQKQEAIRKANRLTRELNRLTTSYNPATDNQLQLTEFKNADGTNSEKHVHFNFAQIYFGEATEFGTPQTVREALTGPEKEKWKDAIGKEAMNFISRKGWKKVPRSLPKALHRKIMKAKTIFKKKLEPDGSIKYKARMVSKGFLMQKGIDYELSFSPVAKETSTHVVIGIYLHQADLENEEKRFHIEVIDIEAAFLEGEAKTRNFLEFPDGLLELGFVTNEESKTHCIEQLKSMYGNVDAALIFFETYKKYMEDVIGMVQSQVDPCVFYKRNEIGETILIAVTHVDDTLLCGTRQAIEDFKIAIKKRFGFTQQQGFIKHLGVWYKERFDDAGERYLEADMHDTVDGIIDTFENITKKKPKPYATPGTPGVSMTKNIGDPVDETSYRKVVGKIMYLVCKLMPEGSNAARELSRHFGNPGEVQWKELERFVGYLKANKDKIKLTFRKPRAMRVVSNVDSNYATNKDDRKSVSGALHTLGGMLVSWLCKTQDVQALSSTEAEYIAAALAACEMKFLQMLLEEIHYVEKPGILLEDNTGCIFLIQNQSVSARTKHIEVRWHYLRQLYQKGELAVTYVQSEKTKVI